MLNVGLKDAVECCLESNRFVVLVEDSLPFRSQPKLVDELFIHA
jgi:hypothetical protein